MAAYKEDFPVGSAVIIADLPFLHQFMDSWKYHHPLEQSQLEHAGEIATVERVSFYHGGDVLYELRGLPGIWHESCLRPTNT
jgi:hypothetical protein